MSDITENDFGIITDPDGTENIWAYGERGVNIETIPRFYINKLNHVFNVQDYGAVADARYLNGAGDRWYQDAGLTTPATDNTPAFQAALADIAAQGGGKLIVPGEGRDATFDEGDYETDYVRDRYYVALNPDPSIGEEGLYSATDGCIWLRESHLELEGVGMPIICTSDQDGLAGDSPKVLAISPGNGWYNHTTPSGGNESDVRPWQEHVAIRGIVFDEQACLQDRDSSGILVRHVRDLTFEDCYFHDLMMHHGEIATGNGSYKVRIHHCTFDNRHSGSENFAVHFDGGRYCLVSDCTMIGVGICNSQGNLDHGYAAEWITVEGCSAYDCPPGAIVFGITGGRHVVYQNNVIMPTGSRTNYIFTTTTYDTGAVAPPEFGRVETEHCVIRGNTVYWDGGGVPVMDLKHDGSDGLWITDNKFMGGGTLMNLNGCDNTYLFNNFINTTRLLQESNSPTNTRIGINHYGPNWSQVTANTQNSVIWMTEQPGGATF